MARIKSHNALVQTNARWRLLWRSRIYHSGILFEWPGSRREKGERTEGAPRKSVGEHLEYLTVFECSNREVKSRPVLGICLDIPLILIRLRRDCSNARNSKNHDKLTKMYLSMKYTVRDYPNSSAYRYADLLR